jgi:hypothetical protein
MANLTPTRKTSEDTLNEWNVKLRSSPVYQNFLKSQGIDQSKPVGLSRSQQGALEKVLEANGMKVPGGMHIDQAGNLNQKNRLARNTAIAAGIAAGGYFAAPAIAGALGAGGAAGGAGAAGAASAAGAAVPSIGAVGGLAAGAFPAIAGTAGASMAGLGAGAAGLGAAGSVGTLGKLAGMGKTLSNYSDTLGDVSQIMGATSAGRGAGRAAESQLLDQRDRTATDRYQTEQAAQMAAGQQDLQRKGFTEQARGGRAKQAAIADMLANFQGTNISVPGIQSANISGGMQMHDGAKQAMGKLREQALLAQLKGDSPGGEDFQGGTILKPQAMSNVPQANGYDKFLNVASSLSGVAGAFGARKK